MKRILPYILILLTLVGLVWVSIQEDKTGKKISMLPSFSKDSKIPYGALAFYDLAETMFEKPFGMATSSAYMTFQDTTFAAPTAYVVINNTFPIDEWDWEEIEYFLNEGNYLFLATQSLPAHIEELLDIEIEGNIWGAQHTRKPGLSFVDSLMQMPDSAALDFEKISMKGYFESWPYNADVLAYSPYVFEGEEAPKPILIRVPFGQGAAIISSTPHLFTNYQVLNQDNFEVSARALAYIPSEASVMWDEYYKVDQLARMGESRNGQGLLSYIQSQPGLKAAWYIFLFSVLLYVFSEVKRKQRIVKIVKPNPNATLEFTETIGQLYYAHQDHASIADKRIKVWLAHVRSTYFLKTHVLDKQFVERLSEKSGVDAQKIDQLVRLISQVRRTGEVNEEKLIDLSVWIEDFYRRTR